MFLFLSFILSSLVAGPVDWKASPDPVSATSNVTKTDNTVLDSSKPGKDKLLTMPSEPKKPDKTEEYAIIHTADGFLPQKIYLKAKQNVKIYITGTTGKNTAFIVDDLNVFKGVTKDNVTEVAFVPVKEGAYSFYCPITNKRGWFIVKGE